eukprot:Em0001g1027a
MFSNNNTAKQGFDTLFSQFNVKLEEDDPCARAIDLAEIQVMEEEEVEVMFEECRSRFPFHKPEAAGCGHLAGGVTDTILETLVKVKQEVGWEGEEGTSREEGTSHQNTIIITESSSYESCDDDPGMEPKQTRRSGSCPPRIRCSPRTIVPPPQYLREHFSRAWLALLRLPLAHHTYKRILVSLHSEVMPHLLDPRLEVDFLTDSYDAGGVISILALNGLFVLVHEYHL